MFGLTLEKLLLIAVLAAFLLGPERLPLYAEKLASFVRTIRGLTETAKARVTEELGPDFDADEWRRLDPRQYDPRRIVRDALTDAPADAPAPLTPPAPTGPGPGARPRPVAPGGWQEALLTRVNRPAPVATLDAPTEAAQTQ
ncbi:Sec-independent protein translocase TatB [Herbiconiux sp. CPCC 205716]|uniref:Sec-independent protein translocase TatB n=1 Tax=Herbiconiux gentiana TaxID=2970912 RepID=A0ABT2GBK4_9MICO|nr:Sec-independent protein translocase TatB [Herbiconiux gentiana]MCS5713555.1 Sec-independent protein translocase TatB [Herbiconiux gentiana]